MRIAFELIGSRKKAVAVIELPPGADGLKIARNIMARYKHVRSVIAKVSGRLDPYRLYRFKLIAGDPDTEVLHREHGYWIKVDPRLVYFSARESEERARIAAKVRAGERVLIMFSGSGPFAIAIARAQPDCDVVCVEINEHAFRYANENVRLNKLSGRITNYLGDVRDIVPGLGKFDRILMPLPERAWQFLDIAFRAALKGTTIHLYGISEQKIKFTDLEKLARAASSLAKIRFRIIGRRRVLPFAKRRWKVRLDLRILK
jgi:tRNA (guanine37-N1)-methyltransferase